MGGGSQVDVVYLKGLRATKIANQLSESHLIGVKLTCSYV